MKLLNTAMMPQEGVYTLIEITREEFVDRVRKHHANGTLESYIGYKATIDILKDMTGLNIPFNRDKTILNEHDSMLIMRLNYRIQDAKSKGSHQPKPDDFLFFICEYESY